MVLIPSCVVCSASLSSSGISFFQQIDHHFRLKHLYSPYRATSPNIILLVTIQVFLASVSFSSWLTFVKWLDSNKFITFGKWIVICSVVLFYMWNDPLLICIYNVSGPSSLETSGAFNTTPSISKLYPGSNFNFPLFFRSNLKTPSLGPVIFPAIGFGNTNTQVSSSAISNHKPFVMVKLVVWHECWILSGCVNRSISQEECPGNWYVTPFLHIAKFLVASLQLLSVFAESSRNLSLFLLTAKYGLLVVNILYCPFANFTGRFITW